MFNGFDGLMLVRWYGHVSVLSCVYNDLDARCYRRLGFYGFVTATPKPVERRRKSYSLLLKIEVRAKKTNNNNNKY